MLTSFALRASTFRVANVSQRFFRASQIVNDKLTVEGLADRVSLSGENVLMRVDLNVPLDKAVRAKITLCAWK